MPPLGHHRRGRRPGPNPYLKNALLACLYERTIPALSQAAAARAQQDLNAIYMATARGRHTVLKPVRDPNQRGRAGRLNY